MEGRREGEKKGRKEGMDHKITGDGKNNLI